MVWICGYWEVVYCELWSEEYLWGEVENKGGKDMTPKCVERILKSALICKQIQQQ